ncbi:MAG TPA: galactose-1-phosphate uridylyltransferase [Bacteriovoracaceae bacterium]|nr:galactose-1-phosphate uridylyltransferase [Bacteriovoracaceae bacterium]
MFKKTLTKPDGRSLYLYSNSPISEGIKATNPVNDGKKASPHQRWHPIRQEWVIYASHRQNRTFLPPKDYSPLSISKSEDFPTEMPEGEYEIAVFENLFPSLNTFTQESPAHPVLTQPSRGVCEVIVFTKDPDSSLTQLPLKRVELVLKVLGERTKELEKNPEIKYVMPFENRGVEMGVTLHHPHGQIYAYSFIPPVQATIMDSMKKHYQAHNSGLLEKIISDELKDGSRILVDSKHAVAFIPVFARYPYETWITTKRKVQYLHELTDEETADLAVVLKTMLLKFDGLWNRTFPYLMTLFQAPVNGKYPEAHLFFQFYPPYRTQDRLKYLAGTELGAGVFVNDSLPEEKAKELKAVMVEVGK